MRKVLAGRAAAGAVVLCGFLGAAVGQGPPAVPLPEGMGIYYKTADGFIPLRDAPPVQAQAKGGFFSPIRSKLQFAGQQASTRVHERRPKFVVKMTSWDERTCALIKLVPGKEGREVPFNLRAASVKEEYLVPVTTELLGMNSTPMQFPIFSITPKEDLEPGEYLIAFNHSGGMAYEFGVDGGEIQSEKPSAKGR